MEILHTFYPVIPNPPKINPDKTDKAAKGKKIIYSKIQVHSLFKCDYTDK